MRAESIAIVARNSYGPNNHVLLFQDKKINILLISESHSTKKSIVIIPHYTIYYGIHPHGTAETTLKPYVKEPYIIDKLQNAIIKMTATTKAATIATISVFQNKVRSRSLSTYRLKFNAQKQITNWRYKL